MTGFDELFQAHRKALAAFVMRNFRGAIAPAEVDDILQEAYISGARSHDPARSPASWLYEVVKCRCYDLLRARGRRPAEDPIDESGETGCVVADDDASPEAAAMGVQAAFRLHAAVADLSPPLREAVDLFYFRELKASEIVALTGIKAVTVRARLFRAIRMLREALAQADGEGSDLIAA